ncbi:major facilitator superfamily domain-containing protein [Diaporthe sp. PMI_573]|nr:major facilitator superfamily domain-containing protein [Diaporthaceae sp. PMI_573]
MSGGSSTATVELHEAPIHKLDGPTPLSEHPSLDIGTSPARPGRTLGKDSPRGSSDRPRSNGDSNRDSISSLPPPSTVSHTVERWNQSRVNVCRVFAAFWSLLVMGMNDSAYGAIIPYLGTYYRLEYTLVSLIFLSPFVGYTLSALLNNLIHEKFGQRGVATICSSCHLIAYVIACVHPPYPVLVVVYMLAGFGNGLGDAAWNAWIGNMANANEVLGVMHAFYGAGGVIAPLIATAMITKANLQWYHFYYIMIAAAAIELAVTVPAFWKATGRVFVDSNPKTSENAGNSTLREALLKMPAARVTWLCALFLLCYVGVEVALGGWIVKFMLEVRNGEPFASGMTAMGFWLGITVGRVVLGFITPMLGEKLAVMIYIPAAMGLELLFWLVPQFIVSAVAVALQGFFLGPLFPAVVVAATKSLPRHLHVSAVGFAAAFGGGGAAILPFAVGAIAQSKGVGVLQPVILALLGVLLLLWLGLPNFSSKKKN